MTIALSLPLKAMFAAVGVAVRFGIVTGPASEAGAVPVAFRRTEILRSAAAVGAGIREVIEPSAGKPHLYRRARASDASAYSRA
jgi:hypothetical protein